MIEFLVGPDDLTRIRFARSPMEELLHSVPVLTGARRLPAHGHWLSAAAPRLAGIDLSVLLALLRGPLVIPDFLALPPESVSGNFGDELAALAATRPEAVRASLDEMDHAQGLPPELRPFREHPERELAALTATIAAYWHAALEPMWPRLQAIHDAEIAYRATQLTTLGLTSVFADLHPDVDYDNGRLRIDKPHHTAVRDCGGMGLVLMPCVFAWPKVLVLHNDPYHPTLTYPPRGIAHLWTDPAHDSAHPIATLLGRSRAALLAHLELPSSTTQLAAYLDLSAPAVSQHIAVLRRCRLVTSRRSGRWVLHERTALANELLGAPQ